MDDVYDTSVLAYWHNRPLVAAEAFAQMAAFLRRLRATHKMFAELLITTRTGFTRLDPDLSDLEAALIERMDDPEWGYLNDDPNDLSFSLGCRSELGFRAGFTDSSSDRRRRFYLSLGCGRTLPPSVRAGSPNSVILVVSPEIETAPLLQTLFNETVLFWRPEYALITRAKVRSALKPAPREMTPGWLTYIADPEVARAVPSELAHRPFADGELIEAADQPGRADDADYVHRLTRLRDALRSQGFLGKLGTLLTARA